MIGTLGSAKQSPQTYATPHSGLFFSALFNAFPLAQTAHAQEPAVDISVGQAVFPDGNLLPSQPIVYSLFITNNSAISLSGIIVSDVVPREIVSTTIINTPNGSTILELSGYPTYSWQIDNLDAFSRVDIYVIGRLASDLSQPAALENKLIGSVAGDSDESNNSSTLQSALTMPKISFATSELSYTETPTMVNVSVILDPINPYGSTQVDYGTFTGLSASALGALPDFEVVSGTVSFEAAVQSTNTISVTLFDDYIDEDNESFQLFLRNPRGASLSGNEQITITITDDDEAGIHLSPPLLSLAEGGPATHYSLTLESQPTAPVVVSLESYPQIQASPSAVTFTSATWDMPQMVDVLAIDDATAEGVHNGKIEHQVASIDQKYDGLATLAVTAGIVDNDRASLHVSTAALTITEGITGLAGTHVYSIGLDTQPTQIITVAVEVDSPIVATPRFLQFGPENWNIEQTVAISTTDDGQIINAAGPIVHRVISNDPAYSKVSIADVALTYVDNDHPEVNVVASNPFTILEGGDERSYEISLNSAPEQPVTIQLTTDSDQVVVVPETITFDSTNWDQSQPLTVTIIDDEEMEGNRESTIEHNTQSSDPSYSALKPAQVVVRIVDNDVMLYLPSYVQGK